MSAPGQLHGARAFALDAIAPMRWKNGGGTTREIAVWPPSAGMDDFDWRISVADIAADGPFSAFPGVDRQIVLLEGTGVRLRARDASFDHRLDTVGAPFAFAGDVAVDATLLDGPTRDFNVMTRRGRCDARIGRVSGAWRVPPQRGTVVLLSIAGDWHCDALGSSFGARAGAIVPLGSGGVLTPVTGSATHPCCLAVMLAPAIDTDTHGTPS
ncbi:hypothetical protein L602_002800000080 [Cupriavidus gilardii J11]|uniref:HutD protein n=1 Tax=Cupriavidus gilardii J11 TaxID=936133 RepID=A0A562BGX0_9BURK|nr:hypothetical protein L602_002800000080 [Cupriavidus gilardii J11]